VLACLRRRDDDFLVQIVGYGDGDRVDVVALEDLLIVVVGVGDPARVGKGARFAGCAAGNRDEICLGHMPQAVCMNVRDEAAADYS